MTDLETLLALEEIRRLKARYFRALDTKDWATFIALFTEDASLAFDATVTQPGVPAAEPTRMPDRATIAQFLPTAFEAVRSVHHGHSPEIDFVDAENATGIWAMTDIVDYGDSVIRGWGHYHETYRREDGAWKIASVHLTRLRYEQALRDRIVL